MAKIRVVDLTCCIQDITKVAFAAVGGDESPKSLEGWVVGQIASARVYSWCHHARK